VTYVPEILETLVASVMVNYVTPSKAAANQISRSKLTFYIRTEFTVVIQQQAMDFRSGSTYKDLLVTQY
jgi:hypothetical protein